MAIETTATFNLDINEMAEEAFERAGLEMRSGYDLKTARRSLNLMGLEWQNRGLNLWTIEEKNFAFTQGTETYTLDADTLDILEAVVRTNPANVTLQIDSSIARVSPVTYAQVPDKLDEGRPNQYWIDRQQSAPVIHIYPGLAYYIAMKKPEAANRIPLLKSDYEEQFELAAEQNRVKSPFRFVPFAEYY